MNCCENCKYWNNEEKDFTTRPLGLGECKSAPVLWKHTELSQDDNDDVFADEYVFTEEGKKINKFVQDGENYAAVLLTKKTFGCIDWEAKLN